MKLKPTTSWRDGEITVWQCSWCGSLVASTRGKPGSCPCCEDTPGREWWRQRPPVGPFIEGFPETAPTADPEQLPLLELAGVE